MELDEFDFAVEIFNQRRATFHPVAAVQVLHPANHFHLGAMDVTADDAVGLMVARHRGERVLVFSDIFHSGLGFGFQIRRQRPVAEPERAPQPVQIQVEVKYPVIQVRAKLFQQMVKVRQSVRLMAVDDEIFFPVGGGVNRLPGHRHVAKSHAHELFDEFIMVAGDVDDLGLPAAFAEQFLDEQVVVVAPEPAKLQFPAINEIADDVKILAIHPAQEVQQFGDAGVLRAQMDVRDPDRPAGHRLVQIQIQI